MPHRRRWPLSGRTDRGPLRWRNWAGNVEARPASVARVTSEDDLVAAVRRAAEAGIPVKAVGAGHSFTALAATDGVLCDLSSYDGVRRFDPDTGEITVQAGIPLWRLNRELDARGRALENLGDIDRQTISGATQTATHGTGIAFGNLATNITGIRIVDASGAVRDSDTEPDLLGAAAVGVGAMGIVSELRLRTVPAFRVAGREAPVDVDEVMADLDGHVDGHDHFELFWFPHTPVALGKWGTRTDEPARPRPRARAVLEDWAVANGAFGLLCRVGRRWPALVPHLNRLATRVLSPSERVDRSPDWFASPRRVRFVEMEWALPREEARPFFGALRRLIDSSGWRISFPVEIRFVASDDLWLSPAHGRDSCYVAVHAYRGTPFQQYFEATETLAWAHGGRPHWGKLHFRTAAELAGRYPRWADAMAVRDDLDPPGPGGRRFTNPHLARVLGP